MLKKTIYALFAVLLMGVSVVDVDAATEYTFEGWSTFSGYYGTATKVSDNITNLKGRSDAIGGMYLGPFNKQADKVTLLGGIKEQTHVELNFDTMSQGEFFEVSLALKNGANAYVSEAVVMTQRITEEQIKLSAGWSDFEAVVTESGLYTYQWEVYTEGTKTYVVFSLLNDGEVIATTGKVDMDGIKTADTLNPIAEQENVTVKYLWFCNVNVAKGVNVYTSLPTLVVDEKIDKEVADVILDSVKNDETLKEIVETNDATVSLVVDPIKEVAEEVKDDFKEVVKDSVVLDFFDISILLETESEEYNLTELKKEIKLEMPLPTDLPEVSEGKARKYFVLRQHGNEIKKLDATLSEDGKSVLFASDKFSTYALAYVDEELPVVEEELPADKEELPPQTGDNVMLYVVLGLITLCGFCFSVSSVKKQFN